MRLINKINNNVAEGLDSNGKHLIAFGRGIGFPKMPYELKDLSQVTMTFYKLDSHFEKLLSEIPEELLALSAEIVDYAQKKLKGQLNPTLVFNLADHIHFALKRVQSSHDFNMHYSPEIAQLYPLENALAEFTLDYIKGKLGIVLPKSEITSITMHLVNSQEELKTTQEEQKLKEILQKIEPVIEKNLMIEIDRDEFNYNRFVNHMRYYLQRIEEGNGSESQNQELFQALKKTGNPEVYQTAKEVADIVAQEVGLANTDDELLYLMIHLNRLYEKNKRE